MWFRGGNEQISNIVLLFFNPPFYFHRLIMCVCTRERGDMKKLRHLTGAHPDHAGPKHKYVEPQAPVDEHLAWHKGLYIAIVLIMSD